MKSSTYKSKSVKSSVTEPIKAVYKEAVSRILPQRVDRNVIKFYDRFDEYYEFTNFYHHPVRIDGHMWPTTEHYFQAQKFVGTPYYDHIRKLPFPRDAFRVSRDPVASRWVRRDWSAVKDNVMLKALRVKFQDERLKQKLLGTKNKTLIEHTSNDSYWADGGDGRGLNKLGKLLMTVRNELRVVEDSNPTRTIAAKDTGSLRRSGSWSNLSSPTSSSSHLDNITNTHSLMGSPSLSNTGTYRLKRRRSLTSNDLYSTRSLYETPTPPTRRLMSYSPSTSRKCSSVTSGTDTYTAPNSYRTVSDPCPNHMSKATNGSRPALSLSSKPSSNFYCSPPHSGVSRHHSSRRDYDIITHTPLSTKF